MSHSNQYDRHVQIRNEEIGTPVGEINRVSSIIAAAVEERVASTQEISTSIPQVH